MCRTPWSRSMSPTCSAHSSPRRAPVIATSHRYSARTGCVLRASAITLATSSGVVAGSGRRVTAGGLADSAGFQAIHSQRFAVAKAPDKMLWTFRIVFAVIGLHTCGWHPARPQSWSRSRGARPDRRSATASPATIAVRPWRTTTSPSSARTARACCRVATGTSCRALISRTEGSGSPAASIPEPDRVADRLRHLLPGRLTAGRVNGEELVRSGAR